MKWRDHKRLAWRMAQAFSLDGPTLVEGSVEPDKKRIVVHTWPKAKRSARNAMYRARQAFLKGNMKKVARYLGIVSHYIEDGLAHGTMDIFSHSEDHSTVEGDIGARVDISSLPLIDSVGEGYVDGEFVFREIDALMKESLSAERLGRALSLLGSAVLSPSPAPPELIESHQRFRELIRKPVFKVMAFSNLMVSALAILFFKDPLWALLLPFCLLLAGWPALFRLLTNYGWALAGATLLGFIYQFDWLRLVLTLILAGETLYLTTIPDLSKWSEKWYLLPTGD